MIASILVWPLRWIVRRLGMGLILTIALLVILLTSATLGLSAVLRGVDGLMLTGVALAGMFCGWLLAASPLPGWLAAILGLMVGVEVVLVSAGGLSRSLFQAGDAWLDFLGQFARWPVDGVSRTTALVSALRYGAAQLSGLVGHLYRWSSAFAAGQAAFEPEATAIAWSLAGWLVAAWSAWAVRRFHQPLSAVVPAAVLLLSAFSYAWARPDAVYIVLGGTLLLLAVTAQLVRERRWSAAGIDFSPEVRLDLGMAVMLLTLAAVSLALVTPSVSVHTIAGWIQRSLVDGTRAGRQMADSLGLASRAGSNATLNRARAVGLPNSSLIGSGPELSREVVMFVRVQDQAPAPATTSAPTSSFYWRSVTYDHYTGHGWSTARTHRVRYKAGSPAVYDRTSAGQRETHLNTARRWIIRQEIEGVQGLGGLLYRAGELFTADRDFVVAWRSSNDAFGAEIGARVYQVESSAPLAGDAELRASGQDYPQWIRERYLSVPEDLPERVKKLAQRLVHGEPTAYDQARAIERNLRTFEYTLDLPAPPADRDVVDYFLFELKKGYCDYYATAMVILARVAGLPARLVVGYASGDYDVATERYVVTAAHAHAWVEIYFPDVGWIEFEPTAGRPPIERPETAGTGGVTQIASELQLRPRAQLQLGKIIGLGLLVSVAGVALGGLGWWVIDDAHMRALPPAELIMLLYQRLRRYGARLGVPTSPGDTPYEFAVGVKARAKRLDQARGSAVVSHPMDAYIDLLTTLYVQSRYSPHALMGSEKRQALAAWRQLHGYLLRNWLRSKRS